MKHVYDIIKELKSTSKRKEKIEIIQKHAKDQAFLKYISITLDRRQNNFYISEIDPNLVMSFLVMEDHVTLEEAIDDVVENIASRKITGDAARCHLATLYHRLDSEEEQFLFDLLIQRDLKCGCGIKTINKALENHHINYMGYMRCSLLNKKTAKKVDFKKGAFSELKSDGMYSNITSDINASVFQTRPGIVIENLPTSLHKDSQLLAAHKVFNGKKMVFHGELLVMRDNVILPRETGNGILNHLTQGGDLEITDKVIVNLWDVVPEKDFKKGVYKFERTERLGMLETALNDLNSEYLKLTEYKIVYSFDEAVEHFKSIVERGLEGTILKDRSNIWKDHTSTTQLKLKVEFECELKVIGYKEGKGKHAKTFGSLECASSDGKLRVNVSGFTDAFRREIWSNINEWISGTKIITARANAVIKDKRTDVYSLFLPRFVEERKDKFEADSFERIKEQEAGAIEAMKLLLGFK